ncbi:hypothetical protein YC2023_006658 [Brassica napus]
MRKNLRRRSARSREQRRGSDRQERGLLDIGNTELEVLAEPSVGSHEIRGVIIFDPDVDGIVIRRRIRLERGAGVQKEASWRTAAAVTTRLLREEKRRLRARGRRHRINMKERVAKLCMGAGDRRGERKSGHGVLWNFFFLAGSRKGRPEYVLITWREGYKSKQGELVKWVLTRRITNSDLEAADLDEDGVVG